MGCGCKKRKPKPAVQQNPSRIKITENPKPVVKNTVTEAEKEIIAQIASELKVNVVLN